MTAKYERALRDSIVVIYPPHGAEACLDGPPHAAGTDAKVAVCVTVHGLHRKSGGITLAAPDHLRMIEASTERLGAAEAFPIIISAVRASLWSAKRGRANISAVEFTNRRSEHAERVQLGCQVLQSTIDGTDLGTASGA